MNRRSPGRKRCCHTGLFTRDIMFTLHTDCFCPELSNLRIGLFSHGASRRVTVLLSRDLSVGPTDQREVICELSNFSSHGMSRNVTAFLSRDLSFGPTDQREVIIELSNFFSHGESRRVSGFMSRIIELSNFFSHGESRRFSLSRDMFLVTNLRIVDFFFTRNVTDGCGGYEGGKL